MTKKNKGHDKQKSLLALRLEFMGVDNMNHATLAQMKDTVRKLQRPYHSYMGFVIGSNRLVEWNLFVKTKKIGSRKDKLALNDKSAKHNLHPNERELYEILEEQHD